MNSGKPILVIDRDESIREVVSYVLEDEGYMVMTVEDEQSALALLPEQEPCLILLDVCSPMMDGPCFITSYRNRASHHAPIIVFTTSPQIEQVASQLGADGFIAKPFDLDDLLSAVVFHLKASCHHP
jgi:DNA-binding response OmpR family regulator